MQERQPAVRFHALRDGRVMPENGEMGQDGAIAVAVLGLHGDGRRIRQPSARDMQHRVRIGTADQLAPAGTVTVLAMWKCPRGRKTGLPECGWPGVTESRSA